MTAQGHPRTRFQRAIEGRWLFHAELAARELGTLTLGEALAVRWFARYLDEVQGVTLLRAHLALASLAELRSPEADCAERLLVGLLGGP